MFRTRHFWLLLTLLLAMVLAACGPAATPTPEPTPTRPVRPTFTPTVVPTDTPVPTPTPQPTDTPIPLPTDTPTPAAPTARVAGDGQVNVRSGPGTAYGEAGQVATGTELEIISSNAAGDWYEVCCVNGQNVWIVARLVDVTGDPALIQVAQNIPAPPTATVAPTRPPVVVQPPAPAQPTQPPAPAAPPAPAFAFDKADNIPPRVNSNRVVSFFAFVWNRGETGVVKDDFMLVVEGPAGRGQAVLTDGQFGDPGLESQFKYNAKVEFIDGPEGTYRAFLTDLAGNAVSEAWEYTVSGDLRTFMPRWKQR